MERNPLLDAPAANDDPLEILLACHRRIEKQLESLKRLRAHLDSHGVDAQASADAQSLLAYFGHAVEKHHHDEEHDVFPLLEQRIGDEGERVRFQALLESIHRDHRALHAAWSRLRKPLEGIGDGLVRALPHGEVHGFIEAYRRHIAIEEQALGQFFDRWLDGTDREALYRAMLARREPGTSRAS